jgi:hypothetical protein
MLVVHPYCCNALKKAVERMWSSYAKVCANQMFQQCTPSQLVTMAVACDAVSENNLPNHKSYSNLGLPRSQLGVFQCSSMTN